MGPRGPDKIRYTLHTGVVQNLKERLSFVLMEILCLLLFQITSTWRFHRTNIVFVLQQCIHPPHSVFVRMIEEPPLHLPDTSETLTHPNKETGEYPYPHMKLGELTSLSFVVEDTQCPSSHRKAAQSLWQRKHAQYCSLFPWTRTLDPTRSVPITKNKAATAT